MFGLLTLLSGQALVLALAALVGVVGMPHGGLDHRVARSLLKPAVGRHWLLLFLTCYLGVMAAVVVGWWLAPLATLLGFVLLSALHFGMADEHPESFPDVALASLRGGMVVWLPALIRPMEFTQLLEWVVPGGCWPDGLLFQPATRGLLSLALAVVVISALASTAEKQLRSIAFVSLFTIAPALVSFAAYFCGWHSVIELYRLTRQAGCLDALDGLKRVIVAAAPLSAAAVLLGVLGWVSVSSQVALTAGIVRVTFVGLSVVAVPHILLHLIAERRNVSLFEGEAAR